MNKSRFLALALVAMVAACDSEDADESAAVTTMAVPSLSADLLADVGELEKKFVDLAGAFAEGKYDWRPADSVRSVREVYLHLASDNYLMPAILGFTPPAATGITTDYATAVAFEKRPLGKDSVVADVSRSFAFLKESLSAMTSERMAGPVTMFGQPFTGQSAWILVATHLHEHLGQLIAYARMNGVVPPWSS